MMDSEGAFETARAKTEAQTILRCLEQRYFPELEPIRSVVIDDDVISPSSYLYKSRDIRLNFGAARFGRLAQFLILHELIHHKLTMQDPDYVKKPYGPAFLSETQELLKLGAYDQLL